MRDTTGQEVDLEVDGIEGREFTGTVARIAPVAEEGTRTITVYVALENPDGTLLGGMFATGAIVEDEARDALALPRGITSWCWRTARWPAATWTWGRSGPAASCRSRGWSPARRW